MIFMFKVIYLLLSCEIGLISPEDFSSSVLPVSIVLRQVFRGWSFSAFAQIIRFLYFIHNIVLPSQNVSNPRVLSLLDSGIYRFLLAYVPYECL